MNSGTVENCFNLGNVSGIQLGSKHVFVGGIGGYSTKKIQNCYNIGQIQGIKINSTPYVGGVIAFIDGAAVEKCANIGSILYEGASAKGTGTITGALYGTHANSFYLNNTELKGIGNLGTEQQPTKIETIDDMPTVLSVVGDAFKADTNNINGGYPLLQWQSSTAN